jgi:hypothetical protein
MYRMFAYTYRYRMRAGHVLYVLMCGDLHQVSPECVVFVVMKVSVLQVSLKP